jgi:signal transduction histidine kinase
MAAQLLHQEPGETAHAAELSRRVLHALERMDELIRSMLDADRLKAGAPPVLALAPCDLVPLAKDVIDDLATLHGERFALRAPQTLSGVWSRLELQRAIWNLLSNAIKYGDAAGKVTLELQQLDRRARVAVHNVGPAIPPEELQRLFSPFTRTTAAVAGGATGWGLGLTQVQRCAEGHGGRVTVRSEPGFGTEFVIELPLDARAAATVSGG